MDRPAEHDVDLWLHLEAFEIGDADIAVTFRDRLARENAWTVEFADRAIMEYKRFVYLMCVAGHPVTPSDEVDQVWHLHLTYTSSYWDEMCNGIVGQALHHGPTKGGAAEEHKFLDWYERTKDSYQHIFGEEPPGDLWPTSSERFNDASVWVRVNTARSRVLPHGWRALFRTNLTQFQIVRNLADLITHAFRLSPLFIILIPVNSCCFGGLNYYPLSAGLLLMLILTTWFCRMDWIYERYARKSAGTFGMIPDPAPSRKEMQAALKDKWFDPNVTLEEKAMRSLHPYHRSQERRESEVA